MNSSTDNVNIAARFTPVIKYRASGGAIATS